MLLNNGDGTFAADVTYGAGDVPRSVAIGDLVGDLDLDLVVANRGNLANGDSDDLSVLLNECILLGDVNLDGAVDLLDVGPFVDVLISGGFQAEADINQDGVVNLLDIQPFIDLLIG